MTNDNATYENFLKLCDSVGKTPSAVALELGIAKSTVSHWKNRKNGMTAATALKVANYFGITVDELKNGVKKAPAEQTLDKIQYNINELRNSTNADENMFGRIHPSAEAREDMIERFNNALNEKNISSAFACSRVGLTHDPLRSLEQQGQAKLIDLKKLADYLEIEFDFTEIEAEAADHYELALHELLDELALLKTGKVLPEAEHIRFHQEIRNF